MNEDLTKFNLSNFLFGESNDPLQAPPSFTKWVQMGSWAAELYEPELLASADARTTITYGGKPITSLALPITLRCWLRRMRRLGRTEWEHAVRPCSLE